MLDTLCFYFGNLINGEKPITLNGWDAAGVRDARTARPSSGLEQPSNLLQRALLHHPNPVKTRVDSNSEVARAAQGQGHGRVRARFPQKH